MQCSQAALESILGTRLSDVGVGLSKSIFFCGSFTLH